MNALVASRMPATGTAYLRIVMLPTRCQAEAALAVLTTRRYLRHHTTSAVDTASANTLRAMSEVICVSCSGIFILAWKGK
jgi:hypothetical protein